MQIDKEALQKLLSLNDRQLSLVINKLAAESGIDPASLNINTKDITSIRNALSGATERDLRRVAEQYEKNLQNRQNKRS